MSTCIVKNPVTGEVLYELSFDTKIDVLNKIEAAEQVLGQWIQMNRTFLLEKWANLIEEHKEYLSHLITNECGKPLSESIHEVEYLVQFIYVYVKDLKSVIQPIKLHEASVIGVIPHWSYPAVAIASKVVTNLGEGHAIIISAPEEAPLTVLCLVALAQEAGVPKHVLQSIVMDEKLTQNLFMKHRAIGKMYYTGMQDDIVLPVQGKKQFNLEVGGQAPVIITAQANMEQAVKQLIRAKFRQNGQTLVAPTHVYVQAAVLSRFLQHLSNQLNQLKLRNGPHHLDTQLGPIKNEAIYKRIEAQIQEALEKGATRLTGEQYIDSATHCYYVTPTILTNVSEKMRVMTEAIMGPILTVESFQQLDEAIAQANARKTRLAAYFFTDDNKEGHYLFRQLHFSNIGWNHGQLLGIQLDIKQKTELGVIGL